MSISRPPKFFSCISHAISVSYVPPHLVHSNLTLSSAGRCFHFWCCTSTAFDLHTLPHPSYLHTKSITLLSFLSHIPSFHHDPYTLSQHPSNLHHIHSTFSSNTTQSFSFVPSFSLSPPTPLIRPLEPQNIHI